MGPGTRAAAAAGKIVFAHCLGERGCFVGAVYIRALQLQPSVRIEA